MRWVAAPMPLACSRMIRASRALQLLVQLLVFAQLESVHQTRWPCPPEPARSRGHRRTTGAAGPSTGSGRRSGSHLASSGSRHPPVPQPLRPPRSARPSPCSDAQPAQLTSGLGRTSETTAPTAPGIHYPDDVTLPGYPITHGLYEYPPRAQPGCLAQRYQSSATCHRPSSRPPTTLKQEPSNKLRSRTSHSPDSPGWFRRSRSSRPDSYQPEGAGVAEAH